jgi:hypothetical protein
MTVTRTLIEEAAALAAIVLFISTAAVWSAIFCGA